jgi:hypothetical protein
MIRTLPALGIAVQPVPARSGDWMRSRGHRNEGYKVGYGVANDT